MNGDMLEYQASVFGKLLKSAKSDINKSFNWYPYGTLGNFVHLKRIFNKYPLDQLMSKSRKTLDIGAADGDLSFFLESLDYSSDIIDFGPTNFNNLEGARLIKKYRSSEVNILEVDLDSQFPKLSERYSLVFFLGILYHLKNPFYILESLSHSAEHLIVSTRIAKYTKDGIRLENQPVAYLLSPTESNNDSTNYWIFSSTGLQRIFERSGWSVMEMYSVGETNASNPSDQDKDERAFALLKSNNFKF